MSSAEQQSSSRPLTDNGDHMSLPDLVHKMRPILGSRCITQMARHTACFRSAGASDSYGSGLKEMDAAGVGFSDSRDSRDVSIMRVVTSWPGVTEAGMVTSGKVVRGASLTKASLRYAGEKISETK